MNVDIWQHFSAPVSFGILDLYVRELSKDAGLARAMADDPVWRRRGVNYHGEIIYNPQASRVRHAKGFIATFRKETMA